MMLADSAQVAEGKLFILGGGWSVTSGKLPSALAIKIEVPWNDANQPHTLGIRLLDSDGNEIVDLTSETFEVGRPAGIPTGTAIDHVLAIQMGPLRCSRPGSVTSGSSRSTITCRTTGAARCMSAPHHIPRRWSSRSDDAREVIVHRTHRARSFADRRRDPLQRAVAHVADGEHARHRRLERQRVARGERGPVRIGPGATDR